MRQVKNVFSPPLVVYRNWNISLLETHWSNRRFLIIHNLFIATITNNNKIDRVFQAGKCFQMFQFIIPLPLASFSILCYSYLRYWKYNRFKLVEMDRERRGGEDIQHIHLKKKRFSQYFFVHGCRAIYLDFLLS